MEWNLTHWTATDYDHFLDDLKTLAEEDYRKFHEKIINANNNLLGVRVPKLREISKQIAKGNVTEYIKVCKNNYTEETMLRGFVIANAPLDYFHFQMETDDFVKLVDNWAICDTFCSSLKKPIAKNREEFFQHINIYLLSPNPWIVRVGLISMLSNYMDEEHISKILTRCDRVKQDDYYVQMAQAWLLATAIGKFPEQTKKYLRRHHLSKSVLKKASQKARDSKRVSPEDRKYLESL